MAERFKSTSEEVQRKTQAALDRLDAAIGEIQDSSSFRSYLSFQARFYQYSPFNVLLIRAQAPGATRVAGYGRWQQLGRTVRRGERGITILVPHIRKVDTDGEAEHRLTGFGVGHVFDVRQTDGVLLPEPLVVPRLEGEQGAELYQQLSQFAASQGVTVRRLLPSFMPSDATMGYYIPDKREIHLAEYSQRQQTKTLAHELGHHVHLSRFGAESQERAERETVAEAAAFVVLAHHGIDSGERSFPYIATWAQDQTRFRAALTTVQKVANTIIAGIDTLSPSAPAAPTTDQVQPARQAWRSATRRG